MRPPPVEGRGGDLSEPRPPTPRPDLRTVPLALAAWAGAAAGTSGRGWPIAVVVVLVLAGATVGWRRQSPRWVAVAVLAAVSVTGAHWHESRLSNGPVARLAGDRAVVRAVLQPTTDAQVWPAKGALPAYSTQRATVLELSSRGETARLRTPVLVLVSGSLVESWRRLPVGSTLEVQGRLQPAETGSDVGALLRVTAAPWVRAPPSAGLRLVERVRSGLRTSVAHRAGEQRALVPALVLGDTSAITPELTADFQTTGLVHLTAVSGANLTLLLAFMLLGARWVGVRGWWLRLVGLGGVVVFVALCRTEPSVLRAAAMGVVALVALGAGSRAAGLRNLAVAMVALLLVDPWLGRSVGFVLSVLATGGIVCWARPWSTALARWLPRAVAETVAVPLAAHLVTLPVVAAISGRVSTVGVLTNAVAGPFVGPATVLGFAAAGVSLLSPFLASVVGFGAAWSTQPILWVAHYGARLPGAAVDWPAHPAGLALLAGLSLAAGLAMPWLLGRRWLVLAVAVVLLAGLLRPPVQAGWPPKDWVLVACDVGQGDGLVIRVADRQAMVVDVGPDPEAMDRCLDTLGITAIPVVALTHFHADHVDGLAAVLRDHRVGRILTGPVSSPTGQATEVFRLAAAARVPVVVPALGARFSVGELTWTSVGPVPPFDAMLGRLGAAGNAEESVESSAENDSSLVAMVEVHGIRILLTGDVEPDGQRAILAAGTDLRADVIKVPHHGSARQDREFFAATGARVAVVSAGLDNDYGHPAPATVSLVRSLGMTLLRTDTQGAVAVVVRSGRLAAVAQTHRTPR